jgi:hypothetical protein
LEALTPTNLLEDQARTAIPLLLLLELPATAFLEPTEATVAVVTAPAAATPATAIKLCYLSYKLLPVLLSSQTTSQHNLEKTKKLSSTLSAPKTLQAKK